MQNNSRALLLALLVATVSCGGCSSRSEDAPPAPVVSATHVKLTDAQRQNVRLYTVQPTSFHKTVETSGVVDFDNDQATSVLAPFSGPVTRVLVSPGDHVKKGDSLAIVDSPDFATALSGYRKALATAQTNRRLADLDKDLIEHNGVARREQDQAETDATNAEADREAALQSLVALGVNPQTLKDIQAGRPAVSAAGIIRAPISGTVVERLVTPGLLLQAGTTPCFTVADLSRVWVMAQLFGSDLASVSRGDLATISGFGTESLTGAIDNIAALVDPDTRAVMARVVVENPKELLKKQMFVRVQIQDHAASTGVLIPVAAILHDDENLPFVYVSRSDSDFARQHVTLGYRSNDQYQISEGLHAGEQIVVDGAIFVQFMQSQ